jgi:dinuclear metal center YbgI/SA1388 family protein
LFAGDNIMVKIKDILEILNKIAPFDIAEDWDNSGLQAGNSTWKVSRIMIGLDVTMPLMEAAKNTDSDLVLTHHPLLITPEKKIDFQTMPGSAVCAAAQNHISIIAMHTNLDKADAGLNDYFTSRIGIENTLPFLPHKYTGLTDGLVQDNEKSSPCRTGLGRIGQLDSPLPLNDLAERIKNDLGLVNVRVTGDMARTVGKVAVCTGSGGSLVDEFIRSGADVYITGDVKYHEARQVEAASKALIDVGHFGSEHMAVDLLAEQLTSEFSTAGLNVEIIKYLKEKDPFTIV